MDHQEKAGPQSAHAGFEDGRAMRPPVRGTVARDDRPPDEHFENGRVDGEWATTMPMPVTLPFSLRGRDRYRIYCATCHGPDGAGRGPTAIRAEELQEPTWVAPKSFVDPDVLPQPVGQVFGTITAGVRTMPAFNELIPPDDRWAIVAHVRELQKELTARRPENRNTETRWGGEGLNTD
jgi:cytochrome c